MGYTSVMAMHVLWRSSFSIEQAQNYAGDDLVIIPEPDVSKIAPHLDHIEILVDGNPSPDALSAPQLKHVVVPWVGLHPKLRAWALDHPQVSVHNSHYNAPFVAQHAFALLMACAHRLVEVDMYFRQGDWRQRYDRSLLNIHLGGKTCLLAGYGAIGKALRPMLEGIGMQVITLRRHRSADSYGTEDLAETLAYADAVIISLPSTPETQQLFNEKAFQAMKPQTLLVNVGRGDVIDQWALYHALQTHKVLSAGIDVWWNYPKSAETRVNTLPSDAPLHTCDNLIMSPHRADDTSSDQLRFDDVLLTLKALAQGERRNQIDITKGY